MILHAQRGNGYSEGHADGVEIWATGETSQPVSVSWTMKMKVKIEHCGTVVKFGDYRLSPSPIVFHVYLAWTVKFQRRGTRASFLVRILTPLIRVAASLMLFLSLAVNICL